MRLSDENLSTLSRALGEEQLNPYHIRLGATHLNIAMDAARNEGRETAEGEVTITRERYLQYQAAETHVKALKEAAKPFAMDRLSGRDFCERFDDETKVMIELPHTGKIKPMAWVYVGDVKRLRVALLQGEDHGNPT